MRLTAPAGSGGRTQTLSASLGCRQSCPGALRNWFPLVFGDSSQNVDGQLVGVGIIHRWELRARLTSNARKARLRSGPSATESTGLCQGADLQ